MGIRQNVAEALRILKRERDQSMTEFAKELEMARSVLEGYMNGTGNPSAATIDHIADKLGIDPVMLTSGIIKPDQSEIVLMLFRDIKAIASLPQKQRKRFAELFLEMVELWDEKSI